METQDPNENERDILEFMAAHLACDHELRDAYTEAMRRIGRVPRAGTEAEDEEF